MLRKALLALAITLCVRNASAAVDPTYDTLRTSRPDGRTIALQNFTFPIDVFTFTLTGKLHLLAPVEGKTPGAVFIGQGSYRLVPALEREQRTLAQWTGKKELTELTDTFEHAVFLGGALVSAAERASAPAQETALPAALDRWDDYLKKQKKDLSTNLHVRLLQEIVDGAGPFFFGWIDGKTHPPAALIVDPRGAESVRLVGRDLGGEQSMMYVSHASKGGIWYASRLKSEIDSGRYSVIAPAADASHYVIDSTIRGSEIDAVTTMAFTPHYNLRVLPVDIYGKLLISSVELARPGDAPEWTAVPFVQEKDDPDAAVVFPAPLERGQQYLLRTRYAGKEVLNDAGDGNFTVTRRVNWYPNVGVFDDLATYELRFRTPEKFSIVGVGTEVENRVEGTDRIAVWKATQPIRVAGFNYGRFKKLTETDASSGATFDVYTNPGTPDIIREINTFLRAANDAAMAGDEDAMSFAGNEIRVDAASLAKSAMADGINTMRTGNVYFGPLADKRVAITQQSQWYFGQSWPTLIYLPYIAFLNGTQRNTLGLNDTKDFVDNVGTHEIAHQWWGHQVGFHSYHDEWLSEGFAEFTSMLVSQQTGGWARYNGYLERARRAILEKPRGAHIANHETGPISQGWRVSTWQNPAAYGVLIYSKGAYVLHMLRMAMWDNQQGDAAFTAMMKEYAKTYAGKSPTTADFQRIVEKHATPSLRLMADNRMDWFFNQWIHGTAIPSYELKLSAKESGAGKYKITGTLTQSGVPDNFAMPVPIYVHFDKSTIVRMGSTVMVGNSSKPIDVEIPMPKKPQKFSVNAMHDILSR